MPIFEVKDKKAIKISPKQGLIEKDIQTLLETNLEEILDIHFLASEYTTSFGGRIDSLGIDKNGSPVILEYKKTQNDNIINQALSYLRWLLDHKAEFEKLLSVNNKLQNKDVGFIEWDSPRVICIAQSFNKFDLDTVAVLPINIELIKFRLYENNIISIDFEGSKEISTDKQLVKTTSNKHPFRKQKEYDIDTHLSKSTDRIVELYKILREMIIALDDSIVEVPKAKYIAFKLSTNFADIVFQKEALKIYLNLPKGQLQDEKNIVEDVSDKGHWGNGDYMFYLRSDDDLKYAFDLIKQSYEYNS